MQARTIQKVIIIGAGPSGLFAAKALRNQGVSVTLLDKEPRVGGKCYTYADKHYPQLKTEWGAAVVAPNYGVVLDAIKEKKLAFEESLMARRDNLDIVQKINSLSLGRKILFAATLGSELYQFTRAVYRYQQIKSNLTNLPVDYELPFAKFAQKYHLENINLLLKPFVSGFGYGAMETCPTYSVLEYMGVGTLPALLAQPLLQKSGLVGIKNGFQSVMEKIAEDFHVITLANVTGILREEQGVKVTYEQNQETKTLEADALILATSPLAWPHLGMTLTDIEKDCVRELSFYRYPVAICEVEGLMPLHQFIPFGLEKEGFGHLALVTTRDNRPSPVGGRLATAYINLPPGNNDFQFDEKHQLQLVEEIKKLSGVKQVTVLQTKVWEDYLPSLPWELRLKLEKMQLSAATSTLYVGAYTLGGFEDVACVAEQATKAVNKYLLHKQNETGLGYLKKEASRAFFFYTNTRAQAVNHVAVNEPKKLCR